MINIFDTEVALDVGVNAAIIYQNIKYWCEKNMANDVHKHDGFYWTYNSVSAFNELFPYLSAKQIRTAIDTLEKRGYIRSGNFNDSQYDRTKWYADLLIYNIDLPCGAKGDSEKGKRDLPEKADSFALEGKPIPDINHIKNQNIKKERKSAGAREASPAPESFDDILDSQEFIKNNPDLRFAFVEYIKLRQRMRRPLTNQALKLVVNDVYVKGNQDPEVMTAIINESIKNGWCDIYPPKEAKEKASPPRRYKTNVRRTGAEAGITIEPLPTKNKAEENINNSEEMDDLFKIDL